MGSEGATTDAAPGVFRGPREHEQHPGNGKAAGAHTTPGTATAIAIIAGRWTAEAIGGVVGIGSTPVEEVRAARCWARRQEAAAAISRGAVAAAVVAALTASPAGLAASSKETSD
eukprot:Skav236370  [mRNA]  locus=scaffold1770:293204:298545:- [translate_table: standard]